MDDISRIRNVAVVGGHHAGKTTLVEAILEHCGAVARRGAVVDGTTTTDHEPEAIAHARSTCVAFASARCGADVELNLIDTPGFIDFLEETKLALAAADAAVVVVDPDPAKLPQTSAIVHFIEERRIPHLFAVNKLERPDADFEGTLAALQGVHGMHVVAEQLPFGMGGAFTGYVDLSERRAYGYHPDGSVAAEIPPDLAARVDELRTVFLEALGDFDDRLLEELLEGIEPSGDEIATDLCNECSHDQIVPVIALSALAARGVGAVVAAIERWFPSPLTQPRVDIESRPIEPRTDGPVVAQIVKTIIHPQSGKLSVARVLTGTVTADAQLAVSSQGGKIVRCGGLYRLQGKKQEPIVSAGPGSIVALARLEGAATGDTLVTPGSAYIMPALAPADPLFAIAIRPKERLDDAKLSLMLERLIEEDPTLRVARAPFTNELQLLGAGEVHVQTATERLARKYRLALETHDPAIAYRETITAGTEVHARYKHQTGGHGQFADVWLRIEPRDRGHGVTFSEQIVGGVIPRQFFPAVEKGVREALQTGSVAGYPVVDVHVTLYDGSYHSVDSSEASFKTAGAMAMREALPKCRPVVLEPIVRVSTQAPRAYTSAIVSLLSAKRAQILGFETSERGDVEIVQALAPQIHLARFCTELRTVTQGLGTFRTEHDRFEAVQDALQAR